jgi:hypothetical protein
MLRIKAEAETGAGAAGAAGPKVAAILSRGAGAAGNSCDSTALILNQNKTWKLFFFLIE